MVRVLVLRHAQSAWNAAGRWQGWADPPLSPAGVAQARAAGPVLAGRVTPGTVVSSDLRRAEHTAQILGGAAAPGVAVIVDPGWREYRVGAWSGHTRPEIEQEWPGMLDRWDRGELDAPPDGERRDDFDARLLRSLQRAAAAADGGSCLVVSHGGVIRSLARQAGQALAGIGNLSGVEIDVEGATYHPRGVVHLLSDQSVR